VFFLSGFLVLALEQVLTKAESSKPKPKPKHGPNDKIAPILVRCRSLTRSMSKTMAVGTTLGEKLESKNMSVRWK
jgi:hypothetical protein